MFCLVLGYSALFWGTQRLCKILEGGVVYDASTRFPLEKSIYIIPTAPSCSRSQLPGVRTIRVPSKKDVGDKPYSDCMHTDSGAASPKAADHRPYPDLSRGKLTLLEDRHHA